VRELCLICVDIPYAQWLENKPSLTTFYSSNLYTVDRLPSSNLYVSETEFDMQMFVLND
jgi:hypothetical protein